MKKLYWSLVVSLSLLLLVACGGGNQMGGGNNDGGNGQTLPPVTNPDSWHFASASGAPTIEASLTLSSGSMAGVAHFRSFTTTSPCPTFDDSFLLSGTIDGKGNLSIASSAVSGLMLFMTGVLAPDRTLVSNGSYHFTGGCAAEETGTLTGVKVQPVTGLFTGTMQLSGNSISISAQLTQGLAADENGLFPLAGTVTVANMCDATFMLHGASVVGDVVDFSSNSGTGLDGLTGVTDPEAQQIELDDYFYSDDCIAGAQGIITRQ